MGLFFGVLVLMDGCVGLVFREWMYVVFILFVDEWIEEPLIRKEVFRFDDIIDVSNEQNFQNKEVRLVSKLII